MENLEAAEEWEAQAKDAEAQVQQLERRQREIATEKARSEDDGGQARITAAQLAAYSDRLRAAVGAYDAAASVLDNCRRGIVSVLATPDADSDWVVDTCEQADRDLVAAKALVPPALGT